VGDSALYLYRNREIRRLNADHSMAPILEAKAARGEISAREAAESPDRNLLRSAIAAEPPELYELRDLPFELRAGDIVLAATDGLASLCYQTLSAELERNADGPAHRIAAALLSAVGKAGNPKQDNATVGVIRNSVTSA
jgi:serine/threonine protein phosphatase PrpC